MKAKTVREVVEKLIGPIEPVGESYTDSQRLENIDQLCELVDLLIGNIQSIERYKDRHEFSIQIIGDKARAFLDNLYLAMLDRAEENTD